VPQNGGVTSGTIMLLGMEERISMILLAYLMKCPACECNNCPPSSAELKNGRSYAFTSPV